MSIPVVTNLVASHYLDYEEAELPAPRFFVGVFWAIIIEIVLAGFAAGLWLTVHELLSR